MNHVNDSDISMAVTKKVRTQGLPKENVGKSDVPKDTMTRLDLKVMHQRKGLGYEKLADTMVWQLETDLKGAMKAQGKKYNDVPRKLGRKHPY